MRSTEGTPKALTISGAVLLLLCVSAARVDAQGVASSFDQLAVLVMPGDTIRVVDVTGREAQGRLGTLSRDALTLVTEAGPRVFGDRDVAQVRQRRDDPLKNGAIIGAVAGATYFLTAAALLRDRDGGQVIVGAAVAWGVLFTGMGAAAGAGIDALLTHPHVIYQKPAGGSSVGVSPLLRPGRLGGAVSVTF